MSLGPHCHYDGTPLTRGHLHYARDGHAPWRFCARSCARRWLLDRMSRGVDAHTREGIRRLSLSEEERVAEDVALAVKAAR